MDFFKEKLTDVFCTEHSRNCNWKRTKIGLGDYITYLSGLDLGKCALKLYLL